jgi:hypothetical protein
MFRRSPESLVLIKQPVRWETPPEHHVYPFSMIGERVVGLVLPHSRPMIEHGYRLDGHESEEELVLPSPRAQRIGAFYERCLARETNDRYNCHTFANYVMGKTVNFAYYVPYRWKQYDLVCSYNLQAGEPYCVVDTCSEGTVSHSMLGINRSDASLGVLGDQGPLMIGQNKDMISMYGATHLVHAQM